MFTGNKTTKKEQRPAYNKRMPTKNIVLIMPVCKNKNKHETPLFPEKVKQEYQIALKERNVVEAN